MAILPDEQWVMISDSIEKKNIARSSHCRKTHCGKGGRVKFPSDYKTKKELKAMNGDVKTYNLNKPMTWEEFKKLPEDLKITYIKKLRNEFKVPDKILAETMGVGRSHFCKIIKDLGLSRGREAAAASKKWEGSEYSKRFFAWCGFHKKTEEVVEYEPVAEEEAVEEEADVSEGEHARVVDSSKDPNYIDSSDPRYPELINTLHRCIDEATNPRVIPTGGRMSFDCKFEDAMKVLEPILSGSRVRLNVDWIVVKEEL